LVVGEGAAPSGHADLAFTGVYKTPLHGWCYHRLADSYEGVESHATYENTPGPIEWQ